MRTIAITLSILATVALAAALGRGAHAEPPSGARPSVVRPSSRLQELQRHPAAAPKGQLAKPWQKVADPLRQAIAALALQGPASNAATAETMRHAGLTTRDDGRIRVTVYVSSLTDVEHRALAASGLEITFASAPHRFAEGWIAPDAVEALATLAFVTSVQPAIPPVSSAGSVTSEGDALLRASDARQTFGVSGQGVTVGVMSDSVDGLATAVASGDLPSGVQVLQAGTGAGEGTAMLEIVHDLAPGAALAFYGPATSGDMIAGMNALASAGARVIVDDLTFFDQPHFEEGPVAQAVNALAAQGVAYVTSAGNFAASDSDRGHYEAQFADGGSIGGLQGTVHAFAPGQVAQSITLLPGGHPRVFLQWNDPFGQSGNDYDLYLVDGGGTIVTSSTTAQTGNGVPLEAVSVDTTGLASPAQVFVVVNLFSGAPRRLEIYYASGVTAIEDATPAGSIAGHANASGATTVGTINADDPNTDDIAPYSSQGPCDLFFPAAEARVKPDVTGIDGVAVSGAAGFPSPFFGTSAAAPHVAAVAALMLEAAPSLTAAQVKGALESSAVDLGAVGVDTVFGAGRVDALAAVAAARATETSPPTITALSARLDGTTLAVQATATDPDADVANWQATVYDASGANLGSTGVVSLDVGGQASVDLTLSVTGIGAGFGAATQVGLVLGDAMGHTSAEARADFSQADPGGPRITSVAFAKRAKKLKIGGSALVRGGTLVEVNGATFNGKVNRPGTRAIARGSTRRLGLQPGPNRIRAIVGGLHSNIIVLPR